MNRTITLSSFGEEFFRKWKCYKKNISNREIKEWLICSDYCIDAKSKNDTLTFTIFPSNLRFKIFKETKQILTQDMKHITNISKEVLDYLKNNKECFSIGIILRNKKLFVHNLNEMSKHLHAQIEDYKTMPEDLQKQKKEEHRLIVDFVNYIDSKKCDKKLVSYFFLVMQTVAFIMEFLIIRENANSIYWISDRDKIISFDDGVIYYLLNALVFLLVKERKKDYKIGLFPFEELQHFDSILRIPDIITGTLSSISSKNGAVFAEKEKHRDVFRDVIYNNPRIFLMYYIWDKIKGHQEFVILNHP